jgi:hypothetical protein
MSDHVPPDEPEDDEAESPGRMLARRWTIAANFRSPADYGIPTAPRFPTERRNDGTLVLVDAEKGEVLSSEEPTNVRR